MLAATVEAAADLDVQILDRFIELKILFRQPLAQLGRQSSRRGDSQLARVRARARDDIQNRFRAGIGKPAPLQRLIEFMPGRCR